MTKSGGLFQHIVLFGHVLHEHGLAVDSDQIAELTRALDYVHIIERNDFFHAARSILVKRQEDLKTFDDLFQKFWRYPQGSLSPKIHPATPLASREIKTEAYAEPISPQADPHDLEDRERASFSPTEVLRKKKFSEMSSDEAEVVERLIQQLPLQLGERKTRRWRSNGKQIIDFRRSLRRSLQTGGRVYQWARRNSKKKPRSMVLFLDISGSMNPFGEMLLNFTQKLITASLRNEAFVFATRLTRITQALRSSEPKKNLDNLVQDWSGGTRIGEAVRTFNRSWGMRVLRKSSVVLFVSDGWDRGDVHQLQTEIARLRRSCHRLIWLNPLLGSKEYEPLTRGMQVAMPYIDDFLPIHNLISMERLVKHLGALSPSHHKRWGVTNAPDESIKVSAVP